MVRGTAGIRRVRYGRERGAVLVEFALILPVLMCLVFGIVTGGSALGTKNSLQNAVREGARFGATLPASGTWATSVRDQVLGVAGSDLTSAQVCVQLVQKTAVGTTVLRSTPASCPFAGAPTVPTATPVNSCVTLVWAERPALFDAFFFQRTLLLRGSAIGRYERTPCN